MHGIASYTKVQTETAGKEQTLVLLFEAALRFTRGGAAEPPLANGDMAGIAGGDGWLQPVIWARPSSRSSSQRRRRKEDVWRR